MKKRLLITLWAIGWSICVSAATSIDMQAHIGTDEAKAAYTAYQTKQTSYYKYTSLSGEGDQLFGALNSLMGSTCKLVIAGKNYNSLRYEYKNVDRDLNTTGNIIGCYDGRTMSGTWDNGKTYNREHIWPQSKGAKDTTTMGYDMQSVRPSYSSINSTRKDKAYGEGSNYYDPNDISINNSCYRTENLGSYRGDAARMILYDYLVYGQRGSYKNSLYKGNAQLLSKLGANGVFESLYILVKWHMQDPPSLTEMVRNDGAQNYQGNRNPFIDYPDIALRILKSDIENKKGNVYNVSVTGNFTAIPSYTYTLKEGFICYLSTNTGAHPTADEIQITGAQYTYNATSGRLTIRNVSGPVTIAVTPTDLDEIELHPAVHKSMQDGKIIILKDGIRYTIVGQRLD